MKKLSLLVLAALSLTGCWTSIWTVAPTTERELPPTTVYTTQVTTPSPKVTTTQTITVTSYNNDWSFYLDLQAVAAAFAESNSVQEFERLLNSSRYMINNLDLNRDGWIDYLRVIEVRQSYYHTFLIQACLAPNVFQDVATLIAEWRSDRLYVEVIGDSWLYGYNYVVRPVFVKRPPLWDIFGRPHYDPWISPYYYGYFPSYYQYPKPVYLNHYQAYVNTYMHNHHYCHHCDYPHQPYWDGYNNMTKPHHRHDYANQHPNDSFDHRVGHAQNTGGVTIQNTGQLRSEIDRQTNSSSASSGTRSTTTQSSSQPTTTNPTRQTGTTTTASQKSSQTATATVRSEQTATSTTRSSGQTTTSTTRSSQTTTTSTSRGQQTSQPSTSVNTRVTKSGETRTTIKTTDSTGRTSTVKRESGSQPQQRSSSTSSGSTQRSSGSSSSSTQRSSGSSSGSSGATRR